MKLHGLMFPMGTFLKASLCSMAAILLSFTLPHSAESETSSWYADVENNNQYHDSIYYMTVSGYASGYGDGSFRPGNTINRAEALKLILNSSGVDVEEQSTLDSTGAIFSDVTEDLWYSSYLQTALKMGVISGYADGTFKGDNTVNRAEAMKMLAIARDINFSETEGDAEEAWFTKYIDFATENALLIPDASGDYLAGQELSRGELCEIIYRLYKDNYTGYTEYGGATWYSTDFIGDGTASGEVYEADKMTAAHKTLPFGTVLKVTNLANNLYVTVKVNDRGPYHDGYIVDLSSGAFQKIASLGTGVIKVRIEEMK